MPKKTRGARKGKAKKLSEGSKTAVVQIGGSVSLDTLTSYLEDFDIQCMPI